EGKNQKTVLSETEEQKIIDAFNNKEIIDDLSAVVTYKEIEEKHYSLNAGQYFEVKIEYVDISNEEFKTKLETYNSNLESLFNESSVLEEEIKSRLKTIKYA